MDSGFFMREEERQTIHRWVEKLGNCNQTRVRVVSCRHGWGQLGMSRSIIGEPLCLAGKPYAWGMGTHADSEIVLHCSKPIKTFRSLVGVDYNRDSLRGQAQMIFSIWNDDRRIGESGVLDVGSSPELLSAEFDGVTDFILKVESTNTISLAHADWAEAELVTTDGETVRVGTPEMATVNDPLPISFVYDGMGSDTWLGHWGIRHTQTEEADHIRHCFITSDPATGLELALELQEYRDCPAVLWNVRFTNRGSVPTPILKQVRTLDLSWGTEQRKILYRSRGAFHYETGRIGAESFRDDFQYLTENLESTPKIVMGGVGGRSSVDWMPYWNFEGNREGLVFGIGWTGQWQAQIEARDYEVRFQAGMEAIHTRLEPGESIRQPSVLMLYWQGGEPIRGHNLLRRFILEKLAPRDGRGNTLTAPACNLTWGGMVASSHLARIKNLAEQKIPLDYYWIDAGWYGQAGPNPDEFSPQWGSQAGDWSINRDTFPSGFREISAAVHATGKKFLLWVEPERAISGTPITREQIGRVHV